MDRDKKLYLFIITMYIIGLLVSLFFVDSVSAQTILTDLECGSASTTDCVYFHHLYDDSDIIMATQNPFYFLLSLAIVFLPSFLIILIIFWILKFLTFLWVWFKL